MKNNYNQREISLSLSLCVRVCVFGGGHGAPFSVFSWLSGHDSDPSQRGALCVDAAAVEVRMGTPSPPLHANTPLSPLSPLFSFFHLSLFLIHPLLLFLFPLPLLSLSLSLLPRTALHDREAKNSTRNPRINSEEGGGGGGVGRVGESAHTRSPPSPPHTHISPHPAHFMICPGSHLCFYPRDPHRVRFYFIALNW